MRAASEVTFTELLREPKAVVALVEHGPVVVHRRGAADLCLSLAAGGGGASSALSILGPALGAIAREPAFASLLGDALPWTALLPDDDRSSFAAELASTIAACASLDTWEPLTTVLHQWAETARYWADPQAQFARGRAGDGDVVSRP